MLGLLLAIVAVQSAGRGAVMNALAQHATLATVRPSADKQVVGDLRLHTLHSKVFRNTRQLRVLVPPGYDAPENRARRYPVLYLNDGQNLFDSTTSIFNPMEWRVDEVVAELVSRGRILPLIVVGIDNMGRRERFREYYAWVDPTLRPPEPDPQGKRYPDFLANEVLPFIESRYRVSSDARMRGIGGSSAGAAAALYTVVTRPGLFGRLLAESPSIYVDDYHIIRDGASVKTWPGRMYFGVGTNESNARTCDPSVTAMPPGALLNDVRRFERMLVEAGVESSRIHTEVVPCGRHDERAWAARLPVALTFLYSTAK